MKHLVLGWMLLMTISVAVAQPAQIMLIRHAEKPADRHDPRLASAGRLRAQAWADYFTASPARTPDALFAAKPSRKRPSVRPIETLEPLATRLHLKIQCPEESADFAKLAQQLLTDPRWRGKKVVVCWVHQQLPQFARALGVKPEPLPWKEDDYRSGYLVTFDRDRPRLEIIQANPTSPASGSTTSATPGTATPAAHGP